MKRNRRREYKFQKTFSLTLPILEKLEQDAQDKGMFESMIVMKALAAYWQAEEIAADKIEQTKKDIVNIIVEEMAVIHEGQPRRETATK